MKVVKNIHNNISLCIDSKGNEVVAFGKGIGFMKPPYEVPIQKVERTFQKKQSMLVLKLLIMPIKISKGVLMKI